MLLVLAVVSVSFGPASSAQDGGSAEPSPAAQESGDGSSAPAEPAPSEPAASSEPEPTEPAPAPAGPSVSTAKTDYVPSELVDLTGAGWQANEQIELFIDDHKDKSWEHRATVTADELGGFYYEFRLPSHFVAVYTVTATGATSGTVETQFDDSITQGSVGSNHNSGNTELTISAPTAAVGNVLVAHMVATDSVSNVRFCPVQSGWNTTTAAPNNLLFRDSQNKIVQQVFWRVADSSNASALSYNFNFRTDCAVVSNLSLGASGSVIAFSGVDTTTAIDAAGGAGGTTSQTTGTAPAVTTATANTHVLRFFGLFKNGTITPTTNRIYSINPAQANVSGKERTAAAFGAAQATAGTTGSFTGNFRTTLDDGDTSGEWVAQTVALRMGGVAATTTSLASSLNPSTYGQSVTFTATVSPNPGGTGTVTFKRGATVLCANATVTGASATCSTSALKAVGSPHSITAEYSGSTNFGASTSSALSQAVNPKTLTGAFTANNKIYDGTAAATVNTTSLPGVIAPDAVTLSVTGAVFNNKNVGVGKPVTANLALAGADAGNYALSSPTANTAADITPRNLTVSATGVDKVYDGTTAATVDLTTDKVVTDVVNASYTSAAFADKNVGTNKNVSVSGISIAGADAGNYNLTNTTAVTTANITAQGVTGSFTADDKVYDGTTAATVLTRSLSGQVLGDNVFLTGGTATFDDKDVGNGKTVTLTGAGLSGTDAGNYTLNPGAITDTANITARDLTVTATGDPKVYDGTTAATVSLSTNKIAGDDVTPANTGAAFTDKHVGTGKTINVTGISISGDDASNYNLTSTTAVASADITARPITVSAVTDTKTYDGTTSSDETPAVTSGNVVVGDTPAFTQTFDDKNVGTGKTLTPGGAVNDGNSGNNYAVTTVTDTTGEITPLAVTGAFTTQDKVYDGTKAATVLTTTVPGAIFGDDVSLTGGTAEFTDKNVGTWTVTLTGAALTGVDAFNYQLTSVGTETARITPAPLFITAISEAKEIGQPDPSFGVDYDGFVNNEDQSVLGGTLVLTFQGVAPTVYGPSTTPPQKRGNYSITPSGLTASNYLITFQPGVYAIAGSYFIFLDEDAIKKGAPPSGFTAPSFTDADINEGTTRIGQRSQLSWFANSANHGKIIDLPSGQVGDEGWFTMKTVPYKWSKAGPTNNGLRNLLKAGPGLGGGSSKEALLDKVPTVTPLRASALKMLETQTVCAIVWKSDISINYDSVINGSLKGDNRGIIAFEVISVSQNGSGSTLPRVSVKVLNATDTTNGPCRDAEPLALLGDAPTPISSSLPKDVTP